VYRLVHPGIQDPQNLGDVVPLGPEHGAGGHVGHVEHQEVQSPGLAGLVHQEDRRIGVLGHGGTQQRVGGYAPCSRRRLGYLGHGAHLLQLGALRTSVDRRTGNPQRSAKSLAETAS
jgi:hypothetical protein